MTRGLRAWNRVAAFIVGLILVAGGAAAIAWWHGDLARWWPDAPIALDPNQYNPPTASWWPWVLLGAGVVLVIVALWWLAAHLRTTRVSSIRLSGSDERGTLALSTGAAVDHLGHLVRALPRVTGYRGRLVRERKRPVLAATVRVTPDADLPELTERLTELTAEFVRASSLPDLGVRVRVQVARRSGKPRHEVA